MAETTPKPPERVNPNQRNVVQNLMGRDERFRLLKPPPETDPEIAVLLESRLRDGLVDVVESGVRLQVSPLQVRKTHITSVLKCQGLYLAQLDEPFTWDVARARGTIAHKAIELTLVRVDGTPLDLVESALRHLERNESTLGDFLREMHTDERHQLVLLATDLVTKFVEDWPALQRGWRPRVESSARLPLFGGLIELVGRVDLALGFPIDGRPGSLLIDFKAGSQRPIEHMVEMRYYALLETLRTKVPPYRVATYYLDGGNFLVEDVTRESLEAVAEQTIEAVKRMMPMWLREHPPALTPGLHCKYCPARDWCQPGTDWMKQLANHDSDYELFKR